MTYNTVVYIDVQLLPLLELQLGHIEILFQISCIVSFPRVVGHGPVTYRHKCIILALVQSNTFRIRLDSLLIDSDFSGYTGKQRIESRHE